LRPEKLHRIFIAIVLNGLNVVRFCHGAKGTLSGTFVE